jgi:hypothetical protein
MTGYLISVKPFWQKSLGECWWDGKGLATNTIGLIENTCCVKQQLLVDDPFPSNGLDIDVMLTSH